VTKLIAYRLLHMIPVLLGISFITFLIMQLAPGDFLSTLELDPQISQESIDAMRARFGLDQHWTVQYVLWLKNIVFHLDFGTSFSRHQPVFSVLRTGFANTLLLGIAAATITWVVAVPLGIVAAVKQYSWFDKSSSLVAFLGISVPEVFLALLLILLAAWTGWFPIGGMRSLNFDTLSPMGKALDMAHHLALPAVVLATVPLASRMRQMRGNLLDVLRADYVTTARAKGLPEGTVIVKHAVRNAINPLITLFGYTLATLLSGSLLVEVVMSWPGLGRITLEALQTRDLYLMMGSVMLSSTMLILGNLIADILLAISDPRIKV
jgi:peptide/nickel transport system permease protein